MEHLGIGLELLAVGMSTVFIILLIVIFGGTLLIKVVNKIAPEEVLPAKKVGTTTNTVIDATTMEVLNKVVCQLTNGKGKIVSAQKK
jgi:oxaloacetate decarboxylase gamma subunit